MGKLRKNQPGYKKSKDKNGRTIWVPDGSQRSSQTAHLSDAKRISSELSGEDNVSRQHNDNYTRTGRLKLSVIDEIDDLCRLHNDAWVYKKEEETKELGVLYKKKIASLIDNDMNWTRNAYVCGVVMDVAGTENAYRESEFRDDTSPITQKIKDEFRPFGEDTQMKWNMKESSAYDAIPLPVFTVGNEESDASLEENLARVDEYAQNINNYDFIPEGETVVTFEETRDRKRAIEEITYDADSRSWKLSGGLNNLSIEEAYETARDRLDYTHESYESYRSQFK